MSRETLEWLNGNTLVGFTDMRGHAWHHRQGADNHYPGAIPVGDVLSRLFDWEPVVNLLGCPCGCGDQIKTISRSDNRHRMGVFSESYEPHGYKPWLLDAVSNILGDTLHVGSAGLLRGGAIAWVQVEVPDNITTPEGVTFRPNLLATTSFDGSTATTYKRTITNVVCDNTRDYALREEGQVFKVKHTRNSGLRLTDAREALEMVHDTAEVYAAEVADLCATTVTDSQWFKFLDAYVPMPDERGRSRTMAQNKQDGLTSMYRNDVRAAQWKGTKFGVLQALDTFQQHEAIVRGAERAERNMVSIINGQLGKMNRTALAALDLVLA